MAESSVQQRDLTEQMRAVQRGLRERARLACVEAEHDERAPAKATFRGANLRGKATAYREAADMIESMLSTGRLRAKWTEADRRNAGSREDL